MKFFTGFKNRAIRFIKDDDGADLLEICAGIVFALILIIGVKAIFDNISGSMDAAGETIEEQFDPANWLDPTSAPTV